MSTLEVTWGEASLGGACEAIPDILHNVKQLQAGKRGGGVVAWGWVGDIYNEDQLHDIQSLEVRWDTVSQPCLEDHPS